MSKYQHRERIAQSISWGHWFTLANIILALLIGTLYLQSANITSSFSAGFYMLVSWLGHFAFLPFVFFIVLLFPLCILFPYSRFLRGIGAVLASFGIFALMLDALFFSRYGFHLNTYALAQLATDAEQWFSGGSFVMLVASMLTFLAIFAIQLLLANLTWKKLTFLSNMRITKPLPGIFILSFFLSHSIHIWADATLYTPITQQDDLFPLSYPTTAKSLMTRHGWIDISSFDRQRNELNNETIQLKYPASTLLCAPQRNVEGSLYVFFDQLSTEQQQFISSQLPQLAAYEGTLVGNTNGAAAVFQSLYAIPDRYQTSVAESQLPPAYLETLNDFGYQTQVFYTAGFHTSLIPQGVPAAALSGQVEQPALGELKIILASHVDLVETVEALQALLTSYNGQVYVSALTANSNGLSSTTENQSLTQRLNVPLWTVRVSVHTMRQFVLLEDLIPSTLERFISCADGLAGLSTGVPLSEPLTGLPRVTTIGSRIYIFEADKTSVLNPNGDVNVFGNNGEMLIGEQPSTTVLMNGLTELQRFNLPR
ncbi:DUF3413 domain-containing protein [Aliidiomarina celeris]|uniref:DUF3413 domain-containing protein n=1 Tax=Aliidiomarina celeris TaxID=2249428 RepID=UPI000DE90E79|nr:DUF3413 domain-containing protein [Aliidiomarina celeris]